MTALLAALLPLSSLAAGLLVLLLAVSIRRRGWVAALIALATLGVALAQTCWHSGNGASTLVAVDAITRLAWLVLLGTAAGLVLMVARHDDGPPGEEALMLLLLATLGACTLAAASHWATVFLGIELVSISAFGLVAYPVAAARAQRLPLEAGIKYLVNSAAASAVMAFGIALIYAGSGSLQLLVPAPMGALDALGLALVLGGLAFKLSLAPMHWWTADVYQGTNMLGTATLATVAKGGVVVVLLRLATQGGDSALPETLALLAVASIILGNLLALQNGAIKRMLAYSSIAHLGYLLAALAVAGPGTPLASEAAVFYLPAYFATTVLAFAVLQAVGDDPQLDEAALDGLFWQRPWLAGLLTLALLSLAGVPLTAGFVAKFYVLAAVVTSGAWALTGVVVLGSAIGLYYYLRVVFAMTRAPGGTGDAAPAPLRLRLVCGASALAVVALGVVPGPALTVIEFASRALVR